jgi:predicted enzyme related to lactoylglutathione lyase
MDKVVHFEIPFDNKSRALKFYSSIFGWEMIDVPDMSYVMVRAAETDENHMVSEKGAINGGLFPRTKETSVPVVVMRVESIDKTIQKVKKSGGTVVTPKQPIPNGSYARVADSEGNIIGIIDTTK